MPGCKLTALPKAMSNADEHTVEIGTWCRTVPVRDVGGGIKIAYLDFLHDRALVKRCAAALAERIAAHDAARAEALMAPEAGAIPLAFLVADLLGIPHVIARKTARGYFDGSVAVDVRSVAALQSERLFLDGASLPAVKDRRVGVLDTVTATGSTLEAVQALVMKAGGTVAWSAVAFIEGDDTPRSDVIALGQLPVFGDARC